MSQPAAATEPKIDGLSDADALHEIGCLIDLAQDAQSVSGTDRAFALLDELKARNPSPEIAALVHYFRANAWHNRVLARSPNTAWNWEQAEAQQQILELRRAVTHEGFQQLAPMRQSQILTNLANQFNTMGRFIEAVELWNRALTSTPNFGMALGNRGHGFVSYANTLYDPGHKRLMLAAAHEAFSAAGANDAVRDNPGYVAALSGFETLREQTAAHTNLAKTAQIKGRGYSLGKSAGERRYRAWCLENGLFINPLNDLGSSPIAARDVLSLPSITEHAPSSYPPTVFGFFNQMKQELISARYFYYEGIHAQGVHFSDRDVLLTNTLDYPAYSLATEKIRAAFRLAYSILDKIGFFLNEYFALGHNPKKVTFRTVWYEPKGAEPRPLLQRFTTCPNLPLRGLFWLSKDMFDEDFQDCTEPEAAELNDIRNHLEHKYLQLHHGFAAFTLSNRMPDSLSYRLSADDFAAKTLRLLTLARGALIYLSLSVHREEYLRKEAKADKGGIVVPMQLEVFDDDWKRRDL